MTPISVIPKPVKCAATGGSFTLTADTTIVAAGAAAAVGQKLAAALAPATGFWPKVVATSTQDAGTIRLRIERGLGAEGYRLSVTPREITIRATQPAGLFYGVQSLRQLLPPDIFREAKVEGVEWTIPCVEIEDAPRFAWRGDDAGCVPALYAQRIRQEVHRPPRAAQVQHPPLASDRRSGLAHRDQALSPV